MKSKFSKLWAAIFSLVLIGAIASTSFAARLQSVQARFLCVAGEALSEGDVVMMKSADGDCYKAKADDSTLRPAIGVAGMKAALGANVSVVTRGQVGGLSALTKGSAVYLSTVAGGTTQTQPTAYSQSIGQAISATQYVIRVERARQKKSVAVAIPDPGGAGVGIAAGYVVWSPPINVTVTALKHIPQAAWVAAASPNDASITVTNAAVGDLATLSVVTALTTGSKNDMGTISNASVVAGTNVTLSLVATGTANAPASTLLIEYIESGE